MPKREIQPATGLYKNGSRWWVRTVRNGVDVPVHRSVSGRFAGYKTVRVTRGQRAGK